MFNNNLQNSFTTLVFSGPPKTYTLQHTDSIAGCNELTMDVLVSCF